MILIDAIFINNGGGKILLDYLIQSITNSNIDAYYLLDTRIKGKHPYIDPCRVKYLPGNIFTRHIFYKNNISSFSSVLCFGNLPPSIKLRAKVYTYFHQPLYLKTPREISFYDKFKIKLKKNVLSKITNNSDVWLVQSSYIKDSLSLEFNICPNKVEIIPFYPPIILSNDHYDRVANSFFYVSNASIHKNHIRLINSFCKFYDNYKIGKLTLTVSDDCVEIKSIIDKKIQNGYPINNIGFIDRKELHKYYFRSEFLIFPSLTESFGLGLIEAIDCGCNIIASDLPYTFEVCKPSIIFDPLNEDSIYESLVNSTDKNAFQKSTPIIKNKINELINLLK